MFWTGCEVADLNQGQKTIKMNHRNKIQSLVSPTDDPGDAPDCITESGPCIWNMAISAINQPIFQNKVSPATQAGFSLPGAAETAKKHASLKIWPTARKRQKNQQKQKNGQKNGKIFLRKPAIFQPLMRGTARQHGFLRIGANLVAKRALGQMGQIHPISTCI